MGQLYNSCTPSEVDAESKNIIESASVCVLCNIYYHAIKFMKYKTYSSVIVK